MGRKVSHFVERIASSMEIPQDLANRDVLVTATGSTRLCIENYKHIQEYTTTQILVLTKNGRLRIAGSSLEMQSYTNDEMLITGHITEIHFQN